LLLANAGTSFASLLLSALELALPGDMFADGFEDNPVMLVLALLAVGLAVIQIVIFIATVVVFLMWLYRAHENLTAFGVPKHQLEYSSGWAVGSFFVPIVSLIIPYRAVR
jgi:heme/copper-type cytochrome/quinol oxidase subunit 2